MALYVYVYGSIRLVINGLVLVGPPTMPAVTPLGADKWLTGIRAQSLVYSAILWRILTVKAVCILFLTAVWWHNGHKKIVMPKATYVRDTGTVPFLHLHNYYRPVGDSGIVWTLTGFWYLLQPLALQRQISIYNTEMNTFIFWHISQFLLGGKDCGEDHQDYTALSAEHRQPQSPQGSHLHPQRPHPPTARSVHTSTLRPEVQTCQVQDSQTKEILILESKILNLDLRTVLL